MKTSVQDSTVSANELTGNSAGKPHFFFQFHHFQICDKVHVKLLREPMACGFEPAARREQGCRLVIPVAAWPLQLRFHLWLRSIQSSPACRWCRALLGLFLFFLHLLIRSVDIWETQSVSSVLLQVVGQCLHEKAEEEWREMERIYKVRWQERIRTETTGRSKTNGGGVRGGQVKETRWGEMRGKREMI